MPNVSKTEKTHGRELSLTGTDPAREAVSCAGVSAAHQDTPSRRSKPPGCGIASIKQRNRSPRAAPTACATCLALPFIEQGSQAFS